VEGVGKDRKTLSEPLGVASDHLESTPTRNAPQKKSSRKILDNEKSKKNQPGHPFKKRLEILPATTEDDALIARERDRRPACLTANKKKQKNNQATKRKETERARKASELIAVLNFDPSTPAGKGRTSDARMGPAASAPLELLLTACVLFFSSFFRPYSPPYLGHTHSAAATCAPPRANREPPRTQRGLRQPAAATMT
jgi:hypothetical protein